MPDDRTGIALQSHRTALLRAVQNGLYHGRPAVRFETRSQLQPHASERADESPGSQTARGPGGFRVNSGGGAGEGTQPRQAADAERKRIGGMASDVWRTGEWSEPASVERFSESAAMKPHANSP